ncbi:MAG: phage holin family protein [Gemmatimonadota bacterium]
MRTLFIRWVINALALYVAVNVVGGIHFTGTAGQLLIVAALFGIVNSALRPVLTVLTCPLVVLTLGLFTFVINAMLLLLTAWLSSQFSLGLVVDGFGAAFVGGLLIGFVSVLLSIFVGESRIQVRRTSDK